MLHGGEGHIHEIVDYGEKSIQAIDKLSQDLKKVKHRNQKQLQKSIKTARDKTKEAIRLGKQGNLSASLKSAKSALFQAKKAQQGLR